MAVQLLRRSFTVADYHRMAEAGILREDDRVELIEGEIVEMTPIGSRHAGCVNRLTQILSGRIEGRAVVSVQNPIRLGERSEPQPDVALLRPRPDFYAQGHPGPEDVFLLVEVAEGSAEVDRSVKIPLYARAGIPEVWLVDLPTERLEVFRRPGPQGYQDTVRLQRGDRVSASGLPGLEPAVDDILG